MNEEELTKLIGTLRFQEGQLLHVLNCEPQNELQKSVQKEAEKLLRQVQDYLDAFIPSRKIKH